MTGFGEASVEHEGAHYFLELRSLNNKYFKAVIRLPEQLQGLEAELEARLRRKLTRGAVTLIAKASDYSEATAFDVNHHALDRYVQQLHNSKSVNNGDISMDVSSLLNLPGVLQPPANEEEVLARAREAFSGLLDKACEKLVEMREREGKATLEELLSQHEVISKRLAVVAERAPTVVDEYQERLRTRIEKMLADAGVPTDPGDLVREVAVYAEKSDIAEEVARLSAHLDQFKDLITAKDSRPIGRTLDFLAQEMLREANTIASKSNDAEIARETVEIKGAIDRIKEQVQNVE